jgi:hypothetical protein
MFQGRHSRIFRPQRLDYMDFKQVAGAHPADYRSPNALAAWLGFAHPTGVARAGGDRRPGTLFLGVATKSST